MTQQTQSLFNLIEQGVSPFHVVNICKERLTKSGFIELNPTEKIRLKNGTLNAIKNILFLIMIRP